MAVSSSALPRLRRPRSLSSCVGVRSRVAFDELRVAVPVVSVAPPLDLFPDLALVLDVWLAAALALVTGLALALALVTGLALGLAIVAVDERDADFRVVVAFSFVSVIVEEGALALAGAVAAGVAASGRTAAKVRVAKARRMRSMGLIVLMMTS